MPLRAIPLLAKHCLPSTTRNALGWLLSVQCQGTASKHVLQSVAKAVCWQFTCCRICRALIAFCSTTSILATCRAHRKCDACSTIYQ